MKDQVLSYRDDTLLVFCDETGNEDLSDPNNPTFGRGGCAVLGSQYNRLIRKPWRQLKREKLGGANKPFHATEFEQTRPTRNQIYAINEFMKRPFDRFAAMLDSRVILPEILDPHGAIALLTTQYLGKVVAKYPVAAVALIFEDSERGNTLVSRDYNLAAMQLANCWGLPVEVDGYFLPKSSMEAGLEVADLIVHTCGRQARHQVAGKDGHVLDFQATFWHSPIPPHYIAVQEVASQPPS